MLKKESYKGSILGAEFSGWPALPSCFLWPQHDYRVGFCIWGWGRVQGWSKWKGPVGCRRGKPEINQPMALVSDTKDPWPKTQTHTLGWISQTGSQNSACVEIIWVVNKNVDSWDPCWDSDSIDLGWDPEMCICTDVADDSDASGLWITLEETPAGHIFPLALCLCSRKWLWI